MFFPGHGSISSANESMKFVLITFMQICGPMECRKAYCLGLQSSGAEQPKRERINPSIQRHAKRRTRNLNAARSRRSACDARRVRRLEDVLREATDERLQVLLHPGWWQDTPMLPHRRVCRAIDGRPEKVKRSYEQRLREAGRENVGWE